MSGMSFLELHRCLTTHIESIENWLTQWRFDEYRLTCVRSCVANSLVDAKVARAKIDEKNAKALRTANNQVEHFTDWLERLNVQIQEIRVKIDKGHTECEFYREQGQAILRADFVNGFKR